MSHPFLSSSSSPSTAPPFILEMRQESGTPSGAASASDFMPSNFTPSAALLLTPTLRDNELWGLLNPQEWQTLLLVLSCLTPSGSFLATAELLGARLHLWPRPMRLRLERLVGRQWRGEPLLRTQTTETGLRLFSPSPLLFEVRHSRVLPADGESETVIPAPEARPVGGLRETIIARNRAIYARPRAEVEAEIERFWQSSRQPSGPEAEPKPQDWTPEERQRHEVSQRLAQVGLTAEQISSVLHSYPLERIEAQLHYLPYRRAHHPAGMLIASIEGNYEPPLGIRPWGVTTEDKVIGDEDIQGEEGSLADSPDAFPTLDVAEGQEITVPHSEDDSRGESNWEGKGDFNA